MVRRSSYDRAIGTPHDGLRRALDAVPGDAIDDRRAVAAAVRRRPGGAVDARREPDQMAPGAHDLVLRDVRAARGGGRLPAVPSRLRLPVQLVLRGCRGRVTPAPSGVCCPGRRSTRSTAYRRHVDDAVGELLTDGSARRRRRPALLELGIHHEQQHQELLLMDIKHVLAQNPLLPEYAEPWEQRASAVRPLAVGWHDARRRHRPDRPRRRRVRLRQRAAPSRRPASSVPARRPPRHRR